MRAERPERNTSGDMYERAVNAVKGAILAVNRRMEISDDKTLVSERTYLQGALDTLEFMQGENNHIAEIVSNYKVEVNETTSLAGNLRGETGSLEPERKGTDWFTSRHMDGI